MDRGIIAAPGIIKPIDRGFVMERSISAQKLRYYVMYWDKVVIPGNNLVYISVPEESDLIASGAISRPRVEFRGSFSGDQVTYAILSCQSIVAEKLVREEDTDWVVHQIGGQFVVPKIFSEDKTIIRVALAGALPVPAGDTPIADIVDFKERRRDELKELRDALDEMYQEILRTPDRDLATKKALSRLQESISRIDQSVVERFARSRKFDLSVHLNLSGKDFTLGASAGALVDFYGTGFTLPIATIAGAVLSLLRIDASAERTFKPAEEKSKLAYLSCASKERLIEDALSKKRIGGN